jgi:uncharacterized protein (TIGR02996 family)
LALFSRDDRTFNLELARSGSTVVEEMHVAGSGPHRTDHGDDATALAAFRRRVLELVGEGWKLSLPDGDLARPIARDPELEAKIVDAGDDARPGLLAVYADWLSERGDPCGDLASLRARKELATDPALAAAVQQLELRREVDLFGLLTQLENHREGARPVWRDGWIDGYDIATSQGTLASFALLAPMARFVRALVFRHSHSPGVRSAIALWPQRAQITSLVVPHTGYAQELLDVLPGLRSLTMPVSTTVRGHAGVSRLVLELGDVRRGRLTGTWPAVTEVVLRYRGVGAAPKPIDLIDDAALPGRPEIILTTSRD